MYVVSVAPFTSFATPGEEFLHYFSLEVLEPGSIVEINLRGRLEPAVVFAVKNAESSRMEIRHSPYQLKKIESVITQNPVFTEKARAFALFLAQYYFMPLGLVLRRFAPRGTLSSLRSAKTFFTKLPSSLDNVEQSLVLVPEKILIPYYNKQNEGNSATIFHAALPLKEQKRIWREIHAGKIKKVIGTRGAIFLPFSNLKTISIKDGENTAHVSYDQNPHVDVRRAALYLAQKFGTKVSIDTENPILELPEAEFILPRKAERHEISKIVDMRQEFKGGNRSILSRHLQKLIGEVVKDPKKNVLLFINRKGFSSGLMCRDCGFIEKCKNCDIPLVYYQKPPKLICHLCGVKVTPPARCSRCAGTNIKYVGTGTERVMEELRKLWPKLSAARLDGDNDYTEEEMLSIFTDFKKGKYQVLVGTELALKAPLLPLKITYAAAITLDPLLSIPDFRMNERIYKIVNALTALSQKEFVLQTYQPENPIFDLAIQNNWENFAREEIALRKILFWPPVSDIVKLLYSGTSSVNAESAAKKLVSLFEQQIQALKKIKVLQDTLAAQIKILGPAPAFIAKSKNLYLWYIILKLPKALQEEKNLPARNRILEIAPKEWDIDVNPIDIS